MDGEAYGLEPGFVEKLSAGTRRFLSELRNRRPLMRWDAAISSRTCGTAMWPRWQNNGTFGDALIAKIHCLV